MALQRFPVEEEYKRNSELSKETVAQLLKWAQAQANLPLISEEDAILFLVSCKYNMEVTQKTISVYYSFKVLHPEIFHNEDLLKDNFNLDYTIGAYLIAPGVTEEGHKVMYTKLTASDFSHFNHEKETNFMICHLDLMLYEAGAVTGWRIVYDMEDAKLSLIYRLNLLLLKNVSYYLQEAYPVQLKGIHFVRPKPFVRYFIGIMKPFLKFSTAEYLQVHDNLEDLYKHIPKALLPKDIGGELDTVQNLQIASNRHFIENRDILIQKQNLLSDESLRPKKQKHFWNYIWS